MSIWSEIERQVSIVTGSPFAIEHRQSVGGGCINSAYRIAGATGRYFVKLNQAARLAMFEAEADGLQALADSAAVRVPLPICSGCAGDSAFLVLEYLELRPGGRGGAERLGQDLAAMHRVLGPQFGWHRDNTIGSTPQENTPSPDWVGFWRDRRLGPQLRLAASQGYRGALQRQGERLLGRLERLFDGYRPAASLLHGDLWGGNWALEASGRPVIFDPAVYYGDRETDIAMTELFGGFDARFYTAYQESFPLDVGYARRKTLYTLYHVLNHLNLFGGGYLAQAQHALDRLLAET
jgi:fructosamine-3-kinase